MPFNFIHRPPRKKEPRPWYESPLWGPLLIALVGAFIAASAQITATILPIYFGPADLCDFSIMIQPGTDNVIVYNNSSTIEKIERINVTDLHSLIKPYKHPVYVKVISVLPKGVNVFLQNKAGALPLNIYMIIKIDSGEYVPGEYEILIQGTGEDGLRRNCTYFLNLQRGVSEENKNIDKIIANNYRIYGNDLEMLNTLVEATQRRNLG